MINSILTAAAIAGLACVYAALPVSGVKLQHENNAASYADTLALSHLIKDKSRHDSVIASALQLMGQRCTNCHGWQEQRVGISFMAMREKARGDEKVKAVLLNLRNTFGQPVHVNANDAPFIHAGTELDKLKQYAIAYAIAYK